LLPPPGLLGWLEMENMHVWIYSQCINAFIYELVMHIRIGTPVGIGLAGFYQAKKNPHTGGLCLTQRG
jgi:hypothetical protein